MCGGDLFSFLFSRYHRSGAASREFLRLHGFPCSPSAELYRGGIVRLSASVQVHPWMFNTFAVELQQRMAHDEWRALITSINLIALNAAMLPGDNLWKWQQRIVALQSKHLARVAPQWQAHGLRLSMQWLNAVPTIFAQPIPIPPPADVPSMDPHVGQATKTVGAADSSTR